jgi:hypothetical protein
MIVAFMHPYITFSLALEEPQRLHGIGKALVPT